MESDDCEKSGFEFEAKRVVVVVLNLNILAQEPSEPLGHEWSLYLQWEGTLTRVTTGEIAVGRV